MEPLVIASAAVVLIYGYRTVIEIMKDVEEDGTWKTVQEALQDGRRVLSSLRKRLHRARSQKIACYDPFVETKTRQPRILLKPQA